jgi:hypothetical protein
VSAGRHDEVGDGAVEVSVDDGRPRRPRVGAAAPAEAPEHAAQLAVVQLGEVVHRRDAAGRRVVASGADTSVVERQKLRLAAKRYDPRDHHRACPGSDHVLCIYDDDDDDVSQV